MIVVCIPAYNEENRIQDVIKRCKNHSDEVIVCNDGSSDETALQAKLAGAKVINHKKNQGKGAALRTLFQSALETDASTIVTIDADGQFLPEEIPKLVEPIEEKNFDIVIGYRFENNEEMPKYRKVGNKLLDKITNLASELPFRDTQSGFRAYSRKALEQVKFTANGFGADSEILINVSKEKLKISEKKVTVLYNTGGKTSTTNPVFHSSDVISSIMEIIAIKHPLKILGLPGIILMIIGIAFAVLMVSHFNETRIFSVPSTLIAIGSLISGLMLLLMSVVLFTISKALNR